jgi:hypothetical protein
MDPTSRPKRGDILTAELMASILDRLARLEGAKDISGLPPNTLFVGVAGGDFAPRSGTTVSSGSVTIYWLSSVSGSTGTIATSGVTIPEAWNISETAYPVSGNSINSGQYVGIWKDAFETWWVAPLECEPPA